MKVYTKYEDDFFRHPKDMEQILVYLKSNGEIHVSTKTIEGMYSDFSESNYSAGWMTVDNKILEEFADYLNDINL